jgi:hypothetical protein
MTKCNAVGHIESEFRIFGERLNVMSAQVAARVVTAFLASVVVSFEYSVAPFQVFGFTSIIQVSLRFAVFVVVMIFAAVGAFLLCRGVDE